MFKALHEAVLVAMCSVARRVRLRPAGPGAPSLLGGQSLSPHTADVVQAGCHQHVAYAAPRKQLTDYNVAHHHEFYLIWVINGHHMGNFN